MRCHAYRPAPTGAFTLRTWRRRRHKRGVAAAPGAHPIRLEGLFGHLAASAVPGVEEVRDGAYRRTLRLPNGNGIVSLTPQPDHVRCQLVLDDFRDLSTAIARCRRLLDLDADPEAVVDALSADPELTALVARHPDSGFPGRSTSTSSR
jgi:3-methyladenine DNA glycosylase/8-oxoguanine DNA glycosylase